MKKIEVIYATQSYTSQHYALEFVDEVKSKFELEIECRNARSYNDIWEQSKKGENFLILFLSTYGDGEPTTDSIEFFESIKKEEDLSKLSYTIFGFGNSRYRKYQGFPKDVIKYFTKFKATNFFQIGYGDGDNLEDDYEEWKDNFLEILENKYKAKKKEFDDTPKPKYKIKWFGKKRKCPPFNKFKMRPNIKTPFLAELLSSRMLVKKKDENDIRCIKELNFSIKKSRILYKEGDHISIYPNNPDELILSYLEKLKVEKEKYEKLVTLVPIDPLRTGYSKNIFVHKTSLMKVFRYYLNLRSIPKKRALRFISEYAKDEKEKKKIKFLSTFNGKDEYSKLIFIPKLNLLNILNMFKSIELPLNVFFEIVPKLEPRVYSIASCYQKDESIVSLVIAKTNFLNHENKIGFGLCSKYLTDLKIGESVYLFHQSSNFYLPDDPKRSILMISVGCALATFKSFLEYRDYIKKNKNAELGKACLYYGCRNKNNDWIFEDEQKGYIKDGILTNLYTAFSRDQKEKIYVQNLLEKNKNEVLEYLKEKSKIYVCGTIKMAESVYNVLVNILIEGIDSIKTREDADLYLEDIYAQEVTDS